MEFLDNIATSLKEQGIEESTIHSDPNTHQAIKLQIESYMMSNGALTRRISTTLSNENFSVKYKGVFFHFIRKEDNKFN